MDETLQEISVVLERHVNDKASKSKLLEVLCMKKRENRKECEICGKELELLQEIEAFCKKDIELKVLIFRKFLRIPLKTVITKPIGPFISRIITRRIEQGGFENLSPIFNKPGYLKGNY